MQGSQNNPSTTSISRSEVLNKLRQVKLVPSAPSTNFILALQRKEKSLLSLENGHIYRGTKSSWPTIQPDMIYDVLKIEFPAYFDEQKRQDFHYALNFLSLTTSGAINNMLAQLDSFLESLGVGQQDYYWQLGEEAQQVKAEQHKFVNPKGKDKMSLKIDLKSYATKQAIALEADKGNTPDSIRRENNVHAKIKHEAKLSSFDINDSQYQLCFDYFEVKIIPAVSNLNVFCKVSELEIDKQDAVAKDLFQTSRQTKKLGHFTANLCYSLVSFKASAVKCDGLDITRKEELPTSEIIDSTIYKQWKEYMVTSAVKDKKLNIQYATAAWDSLFSNLTQKQADCLKDQIQAPKFLVKIENLDISFQVQMHNVLVCAKCDQVRASKYVYVRDCRFVICSDCIVDMCPCKTQCAIIRQPLSQLSFLDREYQAILNYQSEDMNISASDNTFLTTVKNTYKDESEIVSPDQMRLENAIQFKENVSDKNATMLRKRFAGLMANWESKQEADKTKNWNQVRSLARDQVAPAQLLAYKRKKEAVNQGEQSTFAQVNQMI